MRWISYAVCLSLVAVHLSHSMPTAQENLSSSLVKMLDDKIQQITRVLFRIVGRAVLSGGLGGGNAGGGGGGSEDTTRRISIVLPTYPPDEDEEEESTEEPPSATEESATADLSNGIAPESDDSNSVGETKKRSLESKEEGEERAKTPRKSSSSGKRVPGDPRSFRGGSLGGDGDPTGDRPPPLALPSGPGVTTFKTQEEKEAAVGGNVQPEASEKKEVRVPFVPAQSENDLQTAASGEDNEGAESSQEEFSDDIDISETEENSRSKRLGVFGNLFGGASGGASAGGGGSGNFLFDIIRRTADGAARAAGTVYRLVAGTDDLGFSNEVSVPSAALAAAAQTPVTATAPPPPTPAASPPANTTLVAGSGATEQQDENANSPLIPTDTVQQQPIDDGYQTGIPGPITRLFVIANRGIANLVQDLILRLAQTSERIVNFKARLITAII